MHKDWCGMPCCHCPSPCSLDESMPCSPDCEFLGENGETDCEECKRCDAMLLQKELLEELKELEGNGG